MTEDCPGYDRDRGICLLRPGDCEFARAAPVRLDAGDDPGPGEPPDPLSADD